MRKWWPLAAVCLGSFMLIVDTTVVTVALPDIAEGLHASLTSLQWVLNIYTLVLAALTLSAGSIGDLFGRRKIYLFSVAIFGAASLLCGLAPNPAVLITARGIQGIGGAAMFVTSMALLGTTYSGRDRGTAMGVWSAVIGVAAAVGPIFGGLLTQGMSWRAIFYVNVPISVLTFVLTMAFIKESQQPEQARIDIPGIASFAICSATLTYALIQVGENGWSSPSTLGMLALAVVALVVFAVVERKQSHPMLDLALIRNPSFLAIMLTAVASAWGFACLVFTSLWLQSALGLTPITAGLALLPLAVATFVSSTLTGRSLHGVSPRVTIPLSLVLIGGGAALNGVLVHGDADWTALAPGLLVMGAGVGVGMPVTTSAVFASVPPERAGMGSGALATFRQLGQALGVAILGLVFATTIRDELTGKVSDPGAGARALTSGLHDTPTILHAAAAHGVSAVYLATAALTLVVALIAAFCIRSPVPTKTSLNEKPTKVH